MLAAIRRTRCRALHQGEHLKPHPAGPGAWQCVRCGATFTSLADAGLLCLDEHDRKLSAQTMAVVEREAIRQAANRPQIDGGLYRVVKGGLLVGGRIVGGETLKRDRIA